MSAFYDIHINTTGIEPKYTRGTNSNWQKRDDIFNYWVSRPLHAKLDLLRTVIGARLNILVLGQLYEEKTDAQLIEICSDYITGKSKYFVDPAGHYLIIANDKETNKYYIFTNRFGTYHAYWYSENGKNSISTYYTGLAKQAVNKDLDWEGISGFFQMGFFPADTTFLRNIRILKPASCYVFDSSLVLVNAKRYWDWEYDPAEKSISHYIDEFHEAFTSSLRYSLKNKDVALPISGGLDSRTIAGLMDSKMGMNSCWGYSYGYTKDSIETRVASKIARAKHMNFDKYVVPNYLFDKIELIGDSVEYFQYIDGTRQACMVDLLEQRSDVVVGGHWGDVWFDDMGIEKNSSDITNNDWLNVFKKKIVKKGSDWLVEKVVPGNTVNKSALNDYFLDNINNYKHIEDPDFRMKIFKTDQWSFRWTLASIRMYQAGALPVLPFYDNRVTDVFAKIPGHMLKGRHLQVEYLKHYHPDLARIIWQEYQSNLYNYKWLNNRNLIYRAISKAKRTLKPGKHIYRNWEVFYLNETGRKNLEQVLYNDTFCKVVPKNVSADLINRLYSNPSAGNGYAMSMLHTFARFIIRLHS